MNRQTTQQFCLILESADAIQGTIETSAEGRPFRRLAGVDRFAIANGKLVTATIGEPSIWLEAVWHMGQLLLLLADSSQRARLNGLAAPCVSVLRPGDVLQLGDQVVHVSLLNRPYIGVPTTDHIGTKCSYCRAVIHDEPDMRVYECPCCQAAMHHHDQHVTEAERLECVRLASSCGHCQAPITLEEGLTYVPAI